MSHTLLMHCVAPMQSWGTKSRFDDRDTEKEPSKSGIIGLICAAMGIDRNETEPVLKLAKLKMGVRTNKEGILKYDFHSAQNILRADGKGMQDTAITYRHYLADAAFLVGLEGENLDLLQAIQEALKNPHWALCLGRKSFVPSEPLWLEDGIQEKTLKDALCSYPLEIRQSTYKPSRLVLETKEGQGSLRMDQPASSFAERHFMARFVETSTWEAACT